MASDYAIPLCPPDSEVFRVCVGAGHSDLTSRFGTTCTMAVDWVMFGAEHFTENHAHHFLEGVMMPGGMDFDPRASIPATDVGFTRFLLNFFCHTLLPAVRKVMLLSSLHQSIILRR